MKQVNVYPIGTEVWYFDPILEGDCEIKQSIILGSFVHKSEGSLFYFLLDKQVEGYAVRDNEADAIKQRDDSKALICLVDSDVRLERYVRNVPEVAWQVMEYATKPTTVILDNAVNLAPNLIAEDGSIAMRITREPFSKELCYRFQKPIVSTSVNISGMPPAQNYADIAPELLEAADYVCFSRRQEHKPHTPSCIIKIKEDGEITFIRK